MRRKRTGKSQVPAAKSAPLVYRLPEARRCESFWISPLGRPSWEPLRPMNWRRNQPCFPHLSEVDDVLRSVREERRLTLNPGQMEAIGAA